MIKKTLIFILLAFLSLGVIKAENIDNQGDENTEILIKHDKKKKKEVQTDSLGRPTKTGWNFGVLPGISYSNDVGLLFGIVGQIYDYGDGLYPNYKQKIFAKVSYTTKRTGTYRMFYDSDYLIKNHKFMADFTYINDALNDFFGFNGSQSVYNKDWKDPNKEDYLTRAFYLHKVNMLRTAVDFCGTIKHNFGWTGGIGVLSYSIDRVTPGLMDGVPDADSVPTLYELYRQWSIIPENEYFGGIHPYIRGGFLFNNLPCRVNPEKGIYSELFLTYYAAFGNLSNCNNVKLNFTFTQFVPLVKKYLTFAYHICAQNTIIGKSPYYLDNYHNTIYLERDRYYALGGATSLRGVMRNRVWVPGYAFANIELRYNIFDFMIGRQIFSVGLNGFIDAGMATQVYNLNRDDINAAISKQLNDESSWLSKQYAGQTADDVMDDFFNFNSSAFKAHFSGGIGLKVAMNHNFVGSLEWGAPFDRQDNSSMSNFYFELGYLF